MGYYMRFIIDDRKDISLNAIEAGIKTIDPKFNFSEWDLDNEYAELRYGNDLYGEIEIYRIEQGDEEIEELIEDVEDAVEGNKILVLNLLHNTKAMFVLRVLWQGREAEATLDTIAPLWDWLFDNYKGFLQADGEGYYEKGNLILKTE